MALPLSVGERLESTFSEPGRAQAGDRLPSEQEFPGAPFERTLLAIIALSDGSLEALSHFSEQALRDRRDVLYWHETLEAKTSQRVGRNCEPGCGFRTKMTGTGRERLLLRAYRQ